MPNRSSNHRELRVLGSFRNFEGEPLWRARPRVPRRLSSQRKPEFPATCRNLLARPWVRFVNLWRVRSAFKSSFYEIPEIVLERKLQCHLHQPRRRGVHHLTEQRAVDVPVHRRGSEEIRVIESVKALHPKLEGLPFPKSKGFQ